MKVVVITRELKGFSKTVSVIFAIPENITSVNTYARSKFDEHVDEFTSKFIEFRDANWEYHIMEVEKQ